MEKKFIISFEFEAEEYDTEEDIKRELKKMFPKWKDLRVKEKINI